MTTDRTGGPDPRMPSSEGVAALLASLGDVHAEADDDSDATTLLDAMMALRRFDRARAAPARPVIDPDRLADDIRDGWLREGWRADEDDTDWAELARCAVHAVTVPRDAEGNPGAIEGGWLRPASGPVEYVRYASQVEARHAVRTRLGVDHPAGQAPVSEVFNVLTESGYAIVEAVAAPGPAPTTVTSLADLDRLPVGTVLRMRGPRGRGDGSLVERDEGGEWWAQGDSDPQPARVLVGAAVLHVPGVTPPAGGPVDADAVELLDANERLGVALVEVGMVLGLARPDASVQWGAREVIERAHAVMESPTRGPGRRARGAGGVVAARGRHHPSGA